MFNKPSPPSPDLLSSFPSSLIPFPPTPLPLSLSSTGGVLCDPPVLPLRTFPLPCGLEHYQRRGWSECPWTMAAQYTGECGWRRRMGWWGGGGEKGRSLTSIHSSLATCFFLMPTLFPYIHMCTYPLLPQARAPGSPVVIVGTHCDLMRGDAEKDKKKVAMNNLIYEKYLVGKETPLGGEVVLIRLSNDKVLAALTGVTCDCRAQKSLHTPFSHTQDAVLSKCGSLDFPKSLM